MSKFWKVVRILFYLATVILFVPLGYLALVSHYYGASLTMAIVVGWGLYGLSWEIK